MYCEVHGPPSQAVSGGKCEDPSLLGDIRLNNVKALSAHVLFSETGFHYGTHMEARLVLNSEIMSISVSKGLELKYLPIPSEASFYFYFSS